LPTVSRDCQVAWKARDLAWGQNRCDSIAGRRLLAISDGQQSLAPRSPSRSFTATVAVCGKYDTQNEDSVALSPRCVDADEPPRARYSKGASLTGVRADSSATLRREHTRAGHILCPGQPRTIARRCAPRPAGCCSSLLTPTSPRGGIGAHSATATSPALTAAPGHVPTPYSKHPMPKTDPRPASRQTIALPHAAAWRRHGHHQAEHTRLLRVERAGCRAGRRPAPPSFKHDASGTASVTRQPVTVLPEFGAKLGTSNKTQTQRTRTHPPGVEPHRVQPIPPAREAGQPEDSTLLVEPERADLRACG
jgi:hypothetical protein